MTDNDQLFDENTLRAEIAKVWGEHGAHLDVFDHMLKALRARDTELATAQAVTQRLLDSWRPHEDHWDRYQRPNVMVDDSDEPMSDTERAWLASVGSTPTSQDTP